jgi:hypothetical protein
MELAKDAYRHILGGSVVFEHLPPAALDHVVTRGLLIEAAPGETVPPRASAAPASTWCWRSEISA